MYLQHFGLKHDPLGKTINQVVESDQQKQLTNKLNWLSDCKGVGVITGDAGTGKTTAVRQWVNQVNPLTHKVIYQPDNHFQAFDIYSQLAESLSLDKYYRYSKLWRDLKQELLSLNDNKQITPVWILDEAHQLPNNFLMQLPAFLNFSFDTRELMIIILVGLPVLKARLVRSSYAALNSRILFNFNWQEIDDVKQFSELIINAFQQAGKHEKIISDSGLKLIHLSSKGRLRYAHRIITQALQLAYEQKMNHLSDDIMEQAIALLQSYI